MAVAAYIKELFIETPKTDDPKNWPRRKKNIVVLTIAYCAFVGPLGSSIYMPAVLQVKEDLNTTSSLVSATLSVYVLGMGIMPVFWASLCDYLGRRPIYLISMFIFILGSIFAAIARNIWVFFFMRLIQAVGSSSVLAVGGGSLSDVFHSSERGSAFGLYYLGPLVAPMIGPIIGGVISDRIGWRSTMWLLLGTAVIAFLMVLFILPETYRHRIDEVKPTAEHEPAGTISRSHIHSTHSDPTLAATTTLEPIDIHNPLKRKPFNPLRPFVCMRRPINALLITFNALSLGAQFCMNNTLPISFHQVYNLSESTIGLCFCAGGLGSVCGSLLGGRYSDYVIRKWSLTLLSRPHPKFDSKGKITGFHEETSCFCRVENSVWLGVFLLPIGLMLYGWTVQKGLPLACALVGIFLVGFGMMMVYASTTTTIVDANSEGNMATSAVACNSFARGVLGGIAGFLALPMESAMGSGWLYTFWAIMTVVGSAGLVVLVVKAPVWRKRAAEKELNRV
ncbi:major facilitator superfamily domain-containing protein [Linnemannia elongata]|nr:major facilitator superfamily domain-containing protein [Linnemannia elongata]